jgi:hypothetical protein
MSDTKVFRHGNRMAWRVILPRLSTKTDWPVSVMPCALVYIDEASVGSPNNGRTGSFCYVEQVITLNAVCLLWVCRD